MKKSFSTAWSVGRHTGVTPSRTSAGRHKTRALWVGKVKVGGGAPVSVQSMTKTNPTDIRTTVRQIRELEELGCEIIRLAVPDRPTALALSKIKRQIYIPMEADIHFNPQLALEAIKQGVDAIRLNPGNLTNKDAIAEIVKRCQKVHIPIRVGVNSGSVKGWFRSDLRKKEFLVGHSTGILAKPQWSPDYFGADWQTNNSSVRAALEYCRLLENLKFRDIMISIKTSDVLSTIDAYRCVARLCDYPLHLGVTASGTINDATVKSSIAIGVLLLEGIGDTIRVSITGAPHDEVRVGLRILQTLGLKKQGIEVLSCPTCGRCEIDIIKMAEQVKSFVEKLPQPHKPIKVAVMGCAVNGPGEAEECDIGIAGGKGFGVLFKNGERIQKVSESKIVPVLIREIRKLVL